MKQKYLSNIITVGIVILITFGVAGTLLLIRESQIPSSPAKLGRSEPADPVDSVLAEITVLSQIDYDWKVRIDKIRDYIRFPKATNPQLKTGDIISIRISRWESTVKYKGKVCFPGYIKRPKYIEGEAELTTQTSVTHPQPKIIVGKKYLANLFGCFGGTGCQDSGWSGWLYNLYPTVIEYECVKPIPNVTPPAVDPQI